jgi:hypothetical protein
MYRPLPNEVTIKQSTIEGLGLFATQDIPAKHDFGVSHVFDASVDDAYVRTPLGGFVNHSVEPNCELSPPSTSMPLTARRLHLKTLREIKEGEELTTKYSLYSLNK